MCSSDLLGLETVVEKVSITKKAIGEMAKQGIVSKSEATARERGLLAKLDEAGAIEQKQYERAAIYHAANAAADTAKIFTVLRPAGRRTRRGGEIPRGGAPGRRR